MPIKWQENVPVSTLYQDIYFCNENALAETNHVFLQGNNLHTKWHNYNGDFHIIETGFGTGLNFFAAWKLWQDMGSSGHLYFTSIEKHPLNIADITKAISLWPELALYLQEFIAQYPENPAEISILNFAGGNIRLQILWYDINQALPQITRPADAWFLDGFAPAKNPDMWSDNLYKNMNRLTANGGSFATFTAVGNVRRNLQQHGFIVNKIPGFGQKLHMLAGVKQ